MWPLVEHTLFVIYVIIGPVMWLGYGVLLLYSRPKMMLLEKRRPLPEPPPRATILIPAKDEGERIAACIESCLKQDYPNFDVVAIDDRSVDQTGAVMDRLAAENPRLKVLHIQEGTLGEGWTGKNNALFQGSKLAGGEYLVFVDSDVILDADALSRTMALMAGKDYDLLSLLPRLESHSIWEEMIIPLAGSAASTMYLIAWNNDNQKKTAFANGQYLMITRKAYDAIGGHEVVKDRYCEDVEIARQVKIRGLKPRVAWGNDICSVRMYSSLQQIIRGWSRIYYAARTGSPWRTLAAMATLIFCCFTVYAALAWGVFRLSHPGGTMPHYGWLVAGGAHLVLMTFFMSYFYAWSNNSRLNALGFPLAGSILLWIMAKAVYMCATKKVVWRGTSYQHRMADLSTPQT